MCHRPQNIEGRKSQRSQAHLFIYSIHRRAKEKRLKKDAGRTRWSQYFRSMKGGSSPRLDKLLDKDELKVDLDSFSHGKSPFQTNNIKTIEERSRKHILFSNPSRSAMSGCASPRELSIGVDRFCFCSSFCEPIRLSL